MIRYEGTLFRPPSEADSLILQATIGCSYNRCTFCAMYREKRFRVRKLEELVAEIRWAAERAPSVRKVFLADGDALVAKSSFLEALLDQLADAFPNLARVSCYASPQSLQVRSEAEMERLAHKGLSLYYLGIESGHDAVLTALEKGVDAAEMIRVANKAQDAGVKLSTMILLGAGGRGLSQAHARESARVVNEIQPALRQHAGDDSGGRARRCSRSTCAARWIIWTKWNSRPSCGNSWPAWSSAPASSARTMPPIGCSSRARSRRTSPRCWPSSTGRSPIRNTRPSCPAGCGGCEAQSFNSKASGSTHTATAITTRSSSTPSLRKSAKR
jgi:hypothetical protein